MVRVAGARMGGAHSGTLQRLFSNIRATREPVGVIRYPPKLRSSLVPAAKSTLKPAFRRTARDIILSFVSVNTKVVPRVANAYGFFDSVRIG